MSGFLLWWGMRTQMRHFTLIQIRIRPFTLIRIRLIKVIWFCCIEHFESIHWVKIISFSNTRIPTYTCSHRLAQKQPLALTIYMQNTTLDHHKIFFLINTTPLHKCKIFLFYFKRIKMKKEMLPLDIKGYLSLRLRCGPDVALKWQKLLNDPCITPDLRKNWL